MKNKVTKKKLSSRARQDKTTETRKTKKIMKNENLARTNKKRAKQNSGTNFHSTLSLCDGEEETNVYVGMLFENVRQTDLNSTE